MSRLTKVDFNCLNLVVNVDSWVAVLDFFGVAGDDAPAEESASRPRHTGTYGSAGRTSRADPPLRSSAVAAAQAAGAERGVTQTETSIRSLSLVVVTSRGEACRALVSRVRVVGRAEAALHARTFSGRLGALLLSDLTPHSPLWRDRFRTHGDQALTFDYRRSVSELTTFPDRPDGSNDPVGKLHKPVHRRAARRRKCAVDCLSPELRCFGDRFDNRRERFLLYC